MIDVLRVGELILEEMKKEMGEDEFNKLMESPINGCKCGFIKKGDETICPKCEDIK